MNVMMGKATTLKESISITIVIFMGLMSGCPSPDTHAILENQIWIHGSQDCSTNRDSLIQIVQYNENTWILRQNKCIHYEAPFMYLLIGQEKALLVDTGATGEESSFPLYRMVRTILSDWEEAHKVKLSLIVTHTHGHRDHIAGDEQFVGKPDTKLVAAQVDDIKKFFGIQHWPIDHGSVDLGKRVVTIIPIPGHEKASIAFYDQASRLLLTGDTFYPGRLYVEDWGAFKQSIATLLEFSEHHPPMFILGNHIEMSTTPGIDYPTGSTYQPEEHQLPLTIVELKELHLSLIRIDVPVREVHDNFIISPK